MRIFITAPFKKGENKDYIEKLCTSVRQSGFEDFCFVRDVEEYGESAQEGVSMIARAKEEVSKSDVLLLDYDGPATGRMIEVGMAYAMKKKIIVIVKGKDSQIPNTVTGVSDCIIKYEVLEDIIEPMSNLLKKWSIE